MGPQNSRLIETFVHNVRKGKMQTLQTFDWNSFDLLFFYCLILVFVKFGKRSYTGSSK